MKKIMLLLIIFISAIFINSCVGIGDVSIQVHYYVDGTGGNLICLDLNDTEAPSCKHYCSYGCPKNSHYISVNGNGSTPLKTNILFKAIPDEGYKIKNWILNEQVVEDKKDNVFEVYVNSEESTNAIILKVEFETIENEGLGE
ncbi:MAG: hypothetical protein IJ966_03205 [Bacilli bacterium]|nr:hypothetical protein [Bacilli bacterium]